MELTLQTWTAVDGTQWVEVVKAPTFLVMWAGLLVEAGSPQLRWDGEAIWFHEQVAYKIRSYDQDGHQFTLWRCDHNKEIPRE